MCSARAEPSQQVSNFARDARDLPSLWKADSRARLVECRRWVGNGPGGRGGAIRESGRRFPARSQHGLDLVALRKACVDVRRPWYRLRRIEADKARSSEGRRQRREAVDQKQVSAGLTEPPSPTNAGRHGGDYRGCGPNSTSCLGSPASIPTGQSIVVDNHPRVVYATLALDRHRVRVFLSRSALLNCPFYLFALKTGPAPF